MLFVATEGLSKELILDILEGWVEKGSKIHTDDFKTYTGEIGGRGCKHKVIQRYNGKKRFAEGDSQINTAENRLSFLKAWYRTFRGISRKHLNLWINLLTLINIKSNITQKTIHLLNTLISY